MRFTLVVAYIALSLMLFPSSTAATSPKLPQVKKTETRRILPGKDNRLVIRVLDGGWGRASTADIEKVLYSVAQEIWAYFPERELKPILVVHSPGNPMVEYEKGPNGEYLVHITARDTRWSWYAYEFAHEFSHILSNYEHKDENRFSTNQWFEETVCETASLFTLRRMSETWRTDPPDPSWQDYAPALSAYADRFLNESHRRLPPGKTLVDWYQENRQVLSGNPYLRQKNEVVANILLSLFEQDPEGWAAIGYMNLAEMDPRVSFDEFLSNWAGNAPEKYRPFILKAKGMFQPLPGSIISASASHPVNLNHQ